MKYKRLLKEYMMLREQTSLSIIQCFRTARKWSSEEMYILMDLQDYRDIEYMTLEEIRGMLKERWEGIAEESFIEEIENSTYDQLNDMLAGIDFRVFKSEEDKYKYIEE